MGHHLFNHGFTFSGHPVGCSAGFATLSVLENRNPIIPDFDLSTGKIKLHLTSKQFPESTESITKEFDITNTTKKVDFRARGRQAKIRVSCDSNNASWRWGSVRLALQGDGAR